MILWLSHSGEEFTRPEEGKSMRWAVWYYGVFHAFPCAGGVRILRNALKRCRQAPCRYGKTSAGKLGRWGKVYDITNMWVYDFPFWASTSTLAKEDESARWTRRPRWGLPCLVMSVRMYRYLETRWWVTSGHVLANKPPRRKIRKWVKLYDFTNLWFYDFLIWASNLRAQKKGRRCDGQFCFMEFRTPFPVWGRVRILRNALKRCRQSKCLYAKLPQWKFRRRWVKVYDFTILWIYEFATFSFEWVILIFRKKISPCF